MIVSLIFVYRLVAKGVICVVTQNLVRKVDHSEQKFGADFFGAALNMKIRIFRSFILCNFLFWRIALIFDGTSAFLEVLQMFVG